MSHALQLERGSAADYEELIQGCLEGDNDLLPRELCFRRAAVDAPCGLLQPARRNVLAAQRCGIALLAQPCGIDDQPFGEIVKELV